MKVSVKVVEGVVKEASERMAQPSYSQVLVGGFVQEQPAAVKYITASAEDMGGTEAVVNAIFHSALIALCYQRENNRSVRTMGFDELDKVALGDREEILLKKQPAILEYILANVEDKEMQRVLMLMALAMDWVS